MNRIVNLLFVSLIMLSGVSCKNEGKQDFLSLAAERYSVRSFDSTPVGRSKIDGILRAAQLAPTAINAQPQKIYVIESPEMMAKMNEISPCMYGAPHCFIVCYDSEVAARKGEYGSWGEVDATIVITQMMLEAQELGVGTCLVGRFEPDGLVEALNLPHNIKPVLMMPFGYPAENAEPSPRHSDRKSLEETVEFL